MTEEKFWGQYGPGVRRLRGASPLADKPVFTFTELDAPCPFLEYREHKVWHLFQKLQKKMYQHWCVKQCWRD